MPSGERIKFWIYAYTATVGTYTLDGTNAGASYRLASGSTADTASVSGNITFTSVYPDIVGNIHFTTAGGVTVSGAFNLAQPE